MKVTRWVRGLLAVLCALMGLGIWAAPVAANRSTSVQIRLGTFIRLDPQNPIVMGKPLTLSGDIKDQYGRPVVNKSIVFTVDGQYLGQISSDASGKFERTFEKVLDSGKHKLSVSSRETHLLAGASATMTLKILPAQIIIQTVPAIAGVSFEMDGRKFYSNQEGLAHIEMTHPGQYWLHVLVEDYHNPYQKIAFGRWLDEIYVPYRELQVPTADIIQVGLNVYHLQGQSFVDLDGYPVDPQRISELTIRSLQGDYFVWTNGQTRWIPASRVTRRLNGLEETKIYYSVSNVIIDGSNVVNQSQQRFYSNPGGTWTISLILYSLHVNARDGLLDVPVGKTLSLEYPDGKKESIPLDASGQVTLHSLARGVYHLKIEGVGGMSNRIPVALSRNQTVTVNIITTLDLLLVGGLAAILVLGLLFYGRPWLFRAALEKVPRMQRDTVNFKILPRGESPWVSPFYFKATASIRESPRGEDTGVSHETFQLILDRVESSSSNSGRPTKLSLEDQVRLTLAYLYQNLSEAELSRKYGISITTVQRILRKVTPFCAPEDSSLQPSHAKTISSASQQEAKDYRTAVDSTVKGGAL